MNLHVHRNNINRGGGEGEETGWSREGGLFCNNGGSWMIGYWHNSLPTGALETFGCMQKLRKCYLKNLPKTSWVGCLVM